MMSEHMKSNVSAMQLSVSGRSMAQTGAHGRIGRSEISLYAAKPCDIAERPNH